MFQLAIVRWRMPVSNRASTVISSAIISNWSCDNWTTGYLHYHQQCCVHFCDWVISGHARWTVLCSRATYRIAPAIAVTLATSSAWFISHWDKSRRGESIHGWCALPAVTPHTSFHRTTHCCYAAIHCAVPPTPQSATHSLRDTDILTRL